MFSREDTIGTISIMAEPGQDPNKKSVDVTHPQLARTYEVATTLSSLLIPHQDNPYNYHQDNQLYTPWITPDRWDQDIYWLDSGQNTPSNFVIAFIQLIVDFLNMLIDLLLNGMEME